MTIFGDSAVEAVRLFTEGGLKDPDEAWYLAIKSMTTSAATREKGCPKSAFLGLCEMGLVRGIPKGTYTTSYDNKRYALSAIEKLRNNPSLSLNREKLWASVAGDKAHNGQMDVVLSLWKNNLIA
jgi:hypothetical protein